MSMKKGSTGSDVKRLQDALNKVMGAGLDVDGIFGAKTDAAVRLFQTKAGLVSDGVVGKNTLDALSKALSKSTTAPVSESGKVDASKDTSALTDGGKVSIDTAKDTSLKQKQEEAAGGLSTAAKAGIGILGLLAFAKWRKII